MNLWPQINVGEPHECWPWMGYTNRGYGVLGVGGTRTDYAHRLAYADLLGPIPNGLVLDHLVCDNPPCCNPLHVVPCTRGENSARPKLAKTPCINGHPFDGTNTAVAAGRNGRPRRVCRTCRSASQKRRRSA